MSDIKETKHVQQYITVGKKCDVCEKEEIGRRCADWETVSWYHSDWGNDSCESHESRDVCSATCFIKALREAVRILYDTPSGVINDMNINFVKELFKKDLKNLEGDNDV